MAELIRGWYVSAHDLAKEFAVGFFPFEK